MNDEMDGASRDMLLRVREVDPNADPEAVRRYAREIAEADAILQAIEVDATSAPSDTPFSPDWNREHSR